MKATTANLSQMNTPGNGDLSSKRESLTAVLKHCRQKLGYYSIFAALPGMLGSDVQTARVEEATRPAASVARRRARSIARLNPSRTNSALVKPQSQFRLPRR